MNLSGKSDSIPWSGCTESKFETSKLSKWETALTHLAFCLKLSEKERLMCPHSRNCSEVSPIIYFWFRSSSHSKLWRGRGKLSEKRIKAILEPKFTSQQVVSHPSAAGNGLFLQEICAWVTSVLFHTQRRQILCVQWLLQPLSSSKKKTDPSQQLNSKIISLLLPGSGFQ